MLTMYHFSKEAYIYFFISIGHRHYIDNAPLDTFLWEYNKGIRRIFKKFGKLDLSTEFILQTIVNE